MADSFMKPRSALGGGNTSLGDQARKRGVGPGHTGGGSGGSKRGFVEGEFDRIWPSEVPLWFHIHDALYAQKVYDRESKTVIDVETTWFESKKHYVPRNKGKFRNGRRLQSDFICSSGPDMTQPCYGCAVRVSFYAEMDRIAEEKGFRPDKEAPVGSGPQFSLSLALMEKIYEVPQVDGDGKVRKSKKGNPIIRYVPGPILDAEEETPGYKAHFGHRMHWTIGTEHLGQLLGIDAVLRDHCGNCATPMFAQRFVCPACESHIDLPKALADIDLRQAKEKIRTCTICAEKIAFVPIYVCAECDNPKPGRITDFDIRLVKEKTSENKSNVKCVGVRMPGSPDKDLNKHIKELLDKPLDMSLIFAPTPPESQKYILGEDLVKNVDPRKTKKDSAPGSDTEPYGGDSGDAADEITF